MGSLAAAEWPGNGVMCLMAVGGALFFLTQFRTLDLMLLGDESAITDAFFQDLAFGTALVLILGLIAVSFLDPTALEGLLPEVMTALSLFERFTPFVSGVFDLTSVVC